jgi:hypothetical protein
LSDDAKPTMHVVHLYSGNDGQSHSEELDLALEPEQSDTVSGPRRQVIIYLDRELDLSTITKGS